MSPRRIQPERQSTPHFVKPFLHTLNRMRAQERLRPDQLVDRARAILAENVGVAAEVDSTAFAHGTIGILVDHTHYFDGFALMLTLPHGAAVALRPSDSPGIRVFRDGAPVPGDEPSTLERLCEATVAELPLDQQKGMDIAVVSNVPGALWEGQQAAVTLSIARALAGAYSLALPVGGLMNAAAKAVERVNEHVLSAAYPIASAVTSPMAFVLVDTLTGERLIVENGTGTEGPGWALLSAPGEASAPGWLPERVRSVGELQQRLAESGPEGGIRELQHRDLEGALAALPRRFRPLLNYLVTENGRVQKAVVAIRKGDWQMLGALLFMSHASKRTEWKSTRSETDFVVSEAERMSLEGIYGAAQVGESGLCALVAGQPFSVPPFLDAIRPGFANRFGETPDTLLI